MSKKISELTAGTSGYASGDLFIYTDIDDTTEAPTGTTKKTTLQNLLNDLPVQIPNIANVETLAANKTLTDADVSIHRLDPGGASRDVTLPAEAAANRPFSITNTADVYPQDLVIKSDAPATIFTVRPGETASIDPTGTAWVGNIVANKWVEIQLTVFAADADHATGDDQAHFRVADNLAGWNIALPHAQIAGTNGITGTLDIQLRNDTQAADILSTKLTVDSGEDGSDTAAVAAVVNTAEDDLTLNDVISVDVDAVHSGTAGKGLMVTIPCWKSL